MFQLTDISRSFLRVSKVTEKIKTRSKPTPSENFNSHPLLFISTEISEVYAYYREILVNMYIN
jgi:hypothetical protein